MTFRPIGKWACLVSVVLSLAACSRNAQQYLASGDKSFKAGKYSEAVIYYRNAVQVNPKLAQAHYGLARAYLKSASFQDALKEFQSTVDLDPGNSEAQLQLATLLLTGRKYDEAKAAAGKVLTADPNNARAHAILGDRLTLTGDLAGAIREYRMAIKLDPRRIESYSALAAVYRSRGEISEAEGVFLSAVESNPQSVKAREDLSTFYLSQRKFSRAEAELGDASTLSAGDPLPRLMLAKGYMAEGNLAEAEKVFVQLKTIAPDDPGAYRALAMFYRYTRQPAKALTELQSLRASKPKDSWVKASLAETLLDLNRAQEASVPVQELLAADANDARALVLKGRILISERKYPEAETNLDSAAKHAGQNATAWYYLGVAQQSLGLADRAKSSFAQARKLSPGTPGPEVALAELDAGGGDYEAAERLAKANPNIPGAEVLGARAELARGNVRKAEQMVEAELGRDPVSLPALDILESAYARDGRSEEAVRRISALVSQHPQNAGLQFLLARGYFDLKDFPKAASSARQALALDPQIPDAHALLAAIDSARGSTQQAVTEFETEIERHPGNTANYLALAALYKAEGKWQAARSTLEKAKAVDSDSPYVNNNLAYLYLEHGGDPNVALSLAQEAKRALPDSPGAADTLGWAFYKVGAYDSAIAQLSLATQKLPDNPEYRYHLGMAYLGAGRFESAAQAMQRALKSNSSFADAGGAEATLDSIAKRPRK